MSMKCKNIQLEMSSGSWKWWCGAPQRNEDRDHLNQGGSWVSAWGCGIQGKVAGGEEHSTRGSVLATNGKRVEGEPMKDMEKSPSNGKQETVNGQGKKRWVSNKRDGSATSRAAGRSRQNIFTIYQRWLCKLNPAINFLVLSLFITLTNLVRI